MLGVKQVNDGKYTDRNPGLRAAGKQFGFGDTASQCLEYYVSQRETPRVVQKFRNFFEPKAGRPRIFYGTANDPNHHDDTHGIKSNKSDAVGPMVNPQHKTRFEQALIDRKESVYQSRLAPLGRSHLPDIPTKVDPLRTTFGVRITKEGSAQECVSPNKTYKQVLEEAEVGKDLYKVTHLAYDPGETMLPRYSVPKDVRWGLPTPSEPSGTNTKRALDWIFNPGRRELAVSRRADDWREKYQSQLGRGLDPLRETRRVGAGHVYGVLELPDDCSAGDLLHGRAPRNYLRGKDRERALVGSVRHTLKHINYTNFDNLLAAFKHYDIEDKGKISGTDIRRVCDEFAVPLDLELLENLLDYCDSDKDGFINYSQFVGYLNWKLALPPPAGPARPYSTSHIDGDTPRRLKKQIDAALTNYRTSSAKVGGGGGISTRDYRRFGVPTVRTDLAAPRQRRVSDRVNYGDESDAYALVNPSVYTNFGVFDRDFFKTRNAEEIRGIFEGIGVNMGDAVFDSLWQTAKARHPNGDVSVESFRGALEDAQSA